MNKDRYSIIFNSKTGNTRKLADAIHEALPQENCDLFGAVEGDVPASETLYIGFWTDKGSADKATAELLAKLKNISVIISNCNFHCKNPPIHTILLRLVYLVRQIKATSMQLPFFGVCPNRQHPDGIMLCQSSQSACPDAA